MKERSKEDHIGMFDSGMGGLTVFREIKRRLPSESIIYFGDTARLPYGEKSGETVLRYSIENAIFLMERKIKALVIACNTAAAVSVDKLRSIFNIPVIGVIEPGAERAVSSSSSGRIAVLATKGTVNSGAYQMAIRQLRPDAEVFAIPCPLLVPLIEEGMISHPATRLILTDYLQPLRDQSIDTILLGCTHYPALASLLQELVGPEISIVDSATTCAEKLSDLLIQQELSQEASHRGSYQFFVSDSPDKFRILGKYFLDESLSEVCLKAPFS